MASTDSIPVIQDSFEFPRQNEDGSMEPQVMQYQASQSLFNPNGPPRPNAHQRKINALIDAMEEVAKLYEKHEITMDDLIQRLNAQYQRLGYAKNHVYRTWSNYTIQVQKRFDEARGTFESATDERMAQIQRIFDANFCIIPGPSSSMARRRRNILRLPTLRRLLSNPVPEPRIEFLAEGEIRQLSFVREESIDTTRPEMDVVLSSAESVLPGNETLNDFGVTQLAMNQPGSSSEQNESINDNVSTDPINADGMVVEEEEQEIAGQSNQGKKRRRKGAARLLTVKRTKKSTSTGAASTAINPSLARIQPNQRSRIVAARSVPPQNLQNINDSDDAVLSSSTQNRQRTSKLGNLIDESTASTRRSSRLNAASAEERTQQQDSSNVQVPPQAAATVELHQNAVNASSNGLSPANGHHQQQPQPTRVQPSRRTKRQVEEHSVPIQRGFGNDDSTATSQVQNTVLGRSKNSQQQLTQGQLQPQQNQIEESSDTLASNAQISPRTAAPVDLHQNDVNASSNGLSSANGHHQQQPQPTRVQPSRRTKRQVEEHSVPVQRGGGNDGSTAPSQVQKTLLGRSKNNQQQPTQGQLQPQQNQNGESSDTPAPNAQISPRTAAPVDLHQNNVNASSNGLSTANGHHQQQQPQPTRVQPSRANIRQIRERSVPVQRGGGSDGSTVSSQVQNTVLGRPKKSQQQPPQGQHQQQQPIPPQANQVQQLQAMMPQVERQQPVVPQSPPVQQHLIPEGHQQASSDVRQPVQQHVVDPPVHQVQQSFAPAGNQLAPQQPVQQPVVLVAAAAAPLQQPQHLPQNLGGPELHQNLEQQQQVVPQNLPPPAPGTAIVNNNIIDHIRQLPPQQPFGAAIQNAIVGNRLPDHNAYYGLLQQINNNQRELIINLMSTNLELSRATFSAMSNILGQNGNNNNNQ